MMPHALTPLVEVQTALPRIEIDWPLLMEQRAAVLQHSDLPAYLLLPEIHRLINSARHDNLVLMLDTLWHTGARISECLALTPASFVTEISQPYVSIATLKKRGRPSLRQRTQPRLVPLTDRDYLTRVQRYIHTQQLGRNQRIFNITRSAANKRIERLVERLPKRLSIPISPHTFRHSFAINAVLHGTPLPVLQSWLGHSSIDSTLVYTQVLTLETFHLMQRIQF